MTDSYDHNLLLDYVEGEISDADRRRVEQWIADDPRLAALVQGISQDRQALRDAPEPDPPAWIIDELDTSLERSMLLDADVAGAGAEAQAQRFTFWRVLSGLAVAAAVLLAGGVVLMSVQGFKDGPGDPVATGDPADARSREVAMDDPDALNKDDALEPAPPAAVARGHAENLDQRKDAEARFLAEAGAGPGSAMGGSGLAGEGALADGVSPYAADDADRAPDAEVALGYRRLTDGDAGESLERPRAPAGMVARDEMPGGRSRLGAAEEVRAEQSAKLALTDGRFAQRGVSQLAIEVRTRDVSRSLDRLSEVTRNFANTSLTNVEAPDTTVAMSDADPTRRATTGPLSGEGETEFRRNGRAIASEQQGQVAPAATDAPAAGQFAEADADADADGGAGAGGGGAVVDAGTPPVDPARSDGREAEEDVASTAGKKTEPIMFELRLPADQLENVVQMLNAPNGEAFQYAALTHIQVDPARFPRRKTVFDMADDAWPSREPDYGRILREQIATGDDAATTELASPHGLVVPILIAPDTDATQ